MMISRNTGRLPQWFRNGLPQLATLACVLVCGVILHGCTQSRSRSSPLLVREVWRSDFEHGNTDSLAFYRSTTTDDSWLFATDKHGDQLHLLDPKNGSLIRELGGTGTGPGEFMRPNGVSVLMWAPQNGDTAAGQIDGYLFVTERNGGRIQRIALPSLEAVDVIGVGEVKRPYGVTAVIDSTGRPMLLVTDDCENPAERIRRYEWRSDAAVAPHGRFECAAVFGDPGDAGRIDIVESICCDVPRGQVYVCDEDWSRHNVKLYSVDGHFLGRTIADEFIGGEPEGVAIWDTADGREWIVITDQEQFLTTFHVFDRSSGTHVAAFTGLPAIANTDGITLTTEPVGSAVNGMLFAVHDDSEVVAYSLDDVVRAIDDKRVSSSASDDRAMAAGPQR